MRILIVDDNFYVRELIICILENDRIDFHEAESCTQARNCLRNHSYDWLLLDHRLSDGNGLDLLDEIASIPNPPQSALISAEGASPAFRQKAISRGAVAVFEKPIHVEQLRALIHHGIPQDAEP